MTPRLAPRVVREEAERVILLGIERKISKAIIEDQSIMLLSLIKQHKRQQARIEEIKQEKNTYEVHDQK